MIGSSTHDRIRARLSPANSLTVTLICILPLSACATTATSAPAIGSPQGGHASGLAAAAPPNDAAAGLEAKSLDRRAYVRAVLARNPSIESARQGWRAALARARKAGVWEDPMVDLAVAPLSIGSSQAPLGYELGISQHVPWFGKRALESSAAQAEAEASKSDYEAMRRELALTAVTLYDQYFVSTRSLDVNQKHVELMRVMRDSATAQFEAGHGTAQDPLQAEAELAHMEHDSALLSSQRDVTVAQMNELLHRAPELPLPPPPAELPMPAVPVASEAERLESNALAQRSEIAAARQRAQAAQALAERADRDAYPDLTVSTSYNSMWDMPEHRWMVGLGFSLPIASERRLGAADESRALRAQFESEAARLSDAARTQVYVALKQLQESEHVLGLFEKRLLPLGRQQIDAARASFTTSHTSFMSVIAAEKNLRSVELEYQTARAECDRHRAELDRALGRIPGLDEPERRR